jgi:hypothetical protein
MFDLSLNQCYFTYGKEYDRFCIDHVIYRKSYNRLSDKDLLDINIEIYNYITYEMIVHKDSLS